MKVCRVVGVMVGLVLCLSACSTAQFQTLKIFESPGRAVALQVMPDAYGGKGYGHPVSITSEMMIHIMQGLRVERRGLYGSSSSRNAPVASAFSETEIQFFAPLIAKGLSQATPEEMVTFFETATIQTGGLEKNYQLTTSGGFYVAGEHLYVVLSNYSVKTPLWQDVSESHREESSIRSRPLEQLKPEPGRLVFEPEEFMVVSPDGEIGSLFKGKPWQVAIRYRDLEGER